MTSDHNRYSISLLNLPFLHFCIYLKWSGDSDGERWIDNGVEEEEKEDEEDKDE